MKLNKLMPMDVESTRLIDWTNKGSFSYPNSSNIEKVAMNMRHTGSKRNIATVKSNEVTPDQMRNPSCNIIRTATSLMRTLDQMQYESEDYEPPFCKVCAEDEAISMWNKNPLKMEVGNANNKHLVLDLKKSVLYPCEANSVNNENDNMSLDNESDQNEDFVDTEPLNHARLMDYMIVTKLQGKLDGEVNQNTLWRLIDKMVQEGCIENSGKQRSGYFEIEIVRGQLPFNLGFLHVATLNFMSNILVAYSLPVKLRSGTSGSTSSKSQYVPVTAKERSNTRATTMGSARKDKTNVNSAGDGDDPNKGNTHNIANNDGIPSRRRVTIRTVADLNVLDPSEVLLVLASEGSIEDRIFLVREAERRGFHFAKTRTLLRVSFAMYKNAQATSEDDFEGAFNDLDDPDYNPHEEEAEEEEEEEKWNDDIVDEPLQDHADQPTLDHPHEKEVEEEQEEEEEGNAQLLDPDYNPADSDNEYTEEEDGGWIFVERFDIADEPLQDDAQQSTLDQEAFLDDESDDDYYPSSEDESNESDMEGLCDDCRMPLISETESEDDADDSDYHPSSESD